MASCASGVVRKGGLILPLFNNEADWPAWLRAFLYGAGMIYFFLGVSIIADTFVASIEVVTSHRRKVKQKSGRIFTQRVWNDTVATLSLMALGSSAPEIALSVVDLFKNEYFFAPLGAQTIVGSAAFNLLVIVAVCIVVVPSTEVRVIRELPAFYVTAAFSLFAYLWLVLILVIVTPDVVDIWEAALTFAFLPVLIYIAYQVDKRDFGNTRTQALVKVGGELQTIEEEKPTSYVEFETDSITVGATGQLVQVTVNRQGPAGRCFLACRSEGFSAVAGYDFETVDETVEFQEGQMQASFPVQIPQRQQNRVARQFLLMLSVVDGEVEFNPETDGGADGAILTVNVEASEGSNAIIRCLDRVFSLDSVKHGFEDWVDQICSCVYCNGSLEEQREASKADWAMHIVALPWKIFFALVPPTSFAGGWACFFSCLAFIGLLTAWISDLAELFGMVLGICDDVTALIFVALGTSMPDLFASLTAAREEPTADASIVNVTGSNSVNVFLGLGLPWTVGAIYWAINGRTALWESRYPSIASSMEGAAFVVEAKNLGFCVLVFSVACLAALGIIHLRRKFLGFELGGAFTPKVTAGATFVFLWVAFTSVSSWRVMRWDEAALTEFLLVIIGITVLAIAACVMTVVVTMKQGRVVVAKSETEAPSIRNVSSLAAFGTGDHRKKKSERGYTSEDRSGSSDVDSQTSSQKKKVLRRGMSSDSFASCFSTKHGIQVSI